jgi:hypothetical protein
MWMGVVARMERSGMRDPDFAPLHPGYEVRDNSEATMTRRSVLRMTMAVAGLALTPARAMAQGDGPSAPMAALSAYMSEAGTRALPADVVEQAKHHLLDTLAAEVACPPSNKHCCIRYGFADFAALHRG